MNRINDPSVLDVLRQIDTTPSFVYDEQSVLRAIDLVVSLGSSNACKVLFSLKALSEAAILRLMAGRLHGFAVSSVFEACLARNAGGQSVSLHFTAPGIRSEEIEVLRGLCDYLSFNSLSQWDRVGPMVVGHASCGLRVNPGLRFVKDKRYNPCRKYSKLGISLDTLAEVVRKRPEQLRGIRGIHFHTNCDSADFSQLLMTVHHLDEMLRPLLDQVEWMNVGGGYLFQEASSFHGFWEAVQLLQAKYGVTVFVEPGASLVREAGFLVSSVVDIFESDGKTIAILDTTVNHWPEVFEYQFQPDVVGHVDDGNYHYILAGRSCLAGDLFGEYTFEQPIRVGSKVVFANAGAYSFVKAHMFNGINLPTIYILAERRELVLMRRFAYDDFASRCGVDSGVTV